MRVLVEILHPAHVHFFRNAIEIWRERGDEVLVLSREKDVANELLSAYKIPFESISRLGKSKVSLLGEMLTRDVRMFRQARPSSPMSWWASWESRLPRWGQSSVNQR